jgi:hypothetical protein
MIYNFDTDKKERALAALLIYAIYKSRDQTRFKVSTKMWEQVTNFSKLAAKKSENLAEFLEYFRKPMKCTTVLPKYCLTEEHKGVLKTDKNGSIIETSGEEMKSFLTSEIENSDEKKIISTIIRETAFVIMLVRERIEIEKEFKRIGGENE